MDWLTLIFLFPMLMMYAAAGFIGFILCLPAEYYKTKKNGRKFDIKKHFYTFFTLHVKPEKEDYLSEKQYKTALNDYYYHKNDSSDLNKFYMAAFIADLIIVILLCGSAIVNINTPDVVPAESNIAITYTPSPTPITQTVYITTYGKKYHSQNCQYLEKSKFAISLEKAKKRGLTSCSRCAAPP